MFTNTHERFHARELPDQRSNIHLVTARFITERDGTVTWPSLTCGPSPGMPSPTLD
ncbi:hypothetical protein HNR16_002875 [Pseudoclavibacter chungangensis]|uniref:hypothetical protein n=1 Tax=Pseudoclavibacter chungangensis TaxID=587635 RepID=UPI0015C9C735|nr:hypothetical protein [Pseudoclavibacter chungangensis]NYJ68087.1 hypothetical protein [Pseudoclavibacter chungangensis]